MAFFDEDKINRKLEEEKRKQEVIEEKRARERRAHEENCVNIRDAVRKALPEYYKIIKKRREFKYVRSVIPFNIFGKLSKHRIEVHCTKLIDTRDIIVIMDSQGYYYRNSNHFDYETPPNMVEISFEEAVRIISTNILYKYHEEPYIRAKKQVPVFTDTYAKELVENAFIALLTGSKFE